MAKKLAPVVGALTRLGDAVKASNATATTLRQQYGWNFPNLTAAQMATFAYQLRDKLAEIDDADLNQKWDPSELVAKIDEETANTPPYLWNGNGAEAYKTYTGFLEYVETTFSNFFRRKIDWEKAAAAGEMPTALARKTRSLSASIKNITSSVEDLAAKVKDIEGAHEAALSLPTDLESLTEARDAVAALSKNADTDAASIAAHAAQAKELLTELQTKKEEAVRLVARTEDAYSAATTMGLGASFEARAKSLAMSMWVWVGGLFIALIAGSVIGWLRLSLVEQLLKENASASSIWLNTVLSVLSIAAPVWLAWIATKQIGQRFRLAEDYAYKASVAKAYEGYRREAASLDPKFANQLFKSALERLDEPPLRYVEHETFGSPWHEAIRLRASKGKQQEERPSQQRLEPTNGRRKIVEEPDREDEGGEEDEEE